MVLEEDIFLILFFMWFFYFFIGLFLFICIYIYVCTYIVGGDYSWQPSVTVQKAIEAYETQGKSLQIRLLRLKP